VTTNILDELAVFRFKIKVKQIGKGKAFWGQEIRSCVTNIPILHIPVDIFLCPGTMSDETERIVSEVKDFAT
jgi:hypothetical protein